MSPELLHTMDNAKEPLKKKMIYYGGLILLVLVALYLVRKVFNPLAIVSELYNKSMDDIGHIAFASNEVPDNFYRP